MPHFLDPPMNAGGMRQAVPTSRYICAKAPVDLYLYWVAQK